jgi:hypothetical protein
MHRRGLVLARFKFPSRNFSGSATEIRKQLEVSLVTATAEILIMPTPSNYVVQLLSTKVHNINNSSGLTFSSPCRFVVGYFVRRVQK